MIILFTYSSLASHIYIIKYHNLNYKHNLYCSSCWQTMHALEAFSVHADQKDISLGCSMVSSGPSYPWLYHTRNVVLETHRMKFLVHQYECYSFRRQLFISCCPRNGFQSTYICLVIPYQGYSPGNLKGRINDPQIWMHFFQLTFKCAPFTPMNSSRPTYPR